MSPTYRLIPAALLTVIVLGACRRNEPPPPEPVAIDTTAMAAVNEDSIRLAREEEERRRLEEERRRSEAEAAAKAEEMRNTLAEVIYFEFDSDALSDAARATLDGKLAILNDHQVVRLRVAGHADERGSDEYNLALGQRRAAAAKRYLTQQGIGEDRIEVISFGEERPAAEGSSEEAWAQNRRAEFEIVAGGDQIGSPPGQ
jgi:peptidoglycan-associated lipoprotein